MPVVLRELDEQRVQGIDVVETAVFKASDIIVVEADPIRGVLGPDTVSGIFVRPGSLASRASFHPGEGFACTLALVPVEPVVSIDIELFMNRDVLESRSVGLALSEGTRTDGNAGKETQCPVNMTWCRLHFSGLFLEGDAWIEPSDSLRVR